MSKPKKIEELTEAFPITGRRVSLAVSHPDIACYWHPKKNCGFGPEDFSYGSETQMHGGFAMKRKTMFFKNQ